MKGRYRRVVSEALRALGVRRLVLGIHDACFPGGPGEDLGRGTPYGSAAEELLGFASALGFNGLQLGPQGQTDPGNPSPYDGSAFSRNVLSISLPRLVEAGLLPAADFRRLCAAVPDGPEDRVRLAHVERAQREALALAYQHFEGGDRLAAFQAANAGWLEKDAPPAEARRYAFFQLLAHEQHGAFRSRATARGVTLYGDLQIGYSLSDRLSYRPLFLSSYLLGAPPSRTNPEGQPWNYPVLDPAQYREASGAPGPVLRFLGARIDKLFAEFEGLRIDHPHGLVCPWVYRAGEPDPYEALRRGARLFESPDLAEHPELAAYALVAPEQIDRGLMDRRWDDEWVRALTPEQVTRFGVLVEAILARAPRREEILCEVLSTQPRPLREVMGHFGFGRFRVTQKADPRDPSDVYRGENAAPADWIMVGTHDTVPIWGVVRRWRHEGRLTAQADYLAWRLVPEPGERAAVARRLAESPAELAGAELAELFVGPARQVMIWFADLFGLEEPYNVPGTISERNWSLRLTPRWRNEYAARLDRGEALDLARALGWAIRARGKAFVAEHRELVARLRALEGCLP